MAIWKNKKVIGALLGFLCATLVGTLILTSALKAWELRLGDSLYQPGEPSKKIVIVGVDEKTLQELGEFSQWSRLIYAKALQNLQRYKPAVVGFDIFFLAPRDTQGDSDFADILRESQLPVVLGFTSDIQLDPVKRTFVVQTISLPLASLLVGKNSIPAHLGIRTDQDAVARKILFSVLDLSSGKIYDSFSSAIAKQFIKDDKAIPFIDGQLLINYQSRPLLKSSEYTFVSFVDLYNDRFNNFEPQTLRDSIVLIGPTAAVFKDNVVTPLSSKILMPGVEVHANAIQTILDGNFLRYLSVFEKILLTFLLALASVFFFMFTRIRWSVLFLVGVGVAYYFVSFFLFKAGIVMDLVHPYLTLVLAFISTYMYRYVTEFKEKTALEGAFARYVNPTLAKQIAEHPEQLKLGGEQREVTVLFTDIAHFTTIAESLKPESLVAMLNEYLEAMSDVIMAEGGTVDKYEGDAIMAFFGAPLPQADHPVRACKTALLMRSRLDELLKKWANDPPLPGGEKKPMIDFRCGLSSGKVIVGNVGSSQKLEYTVIGDIVNLGSRLEGANKKYDTRIMMSEATLQLVEDHFEARELDIIKVVGKDKPIKVYELLNYKNQLLPEAIKLLTLYNEGMALYHRRMFAEALAKFEEILKAYPQDGPSKLYRQRCEVLKDFPPPPNWDGVFAMGTK